MSLLLEAFPTMGILQESHLDKTPYEVKEQIFSYMDPPDVLQAILTNESCCYPAISALWTQQEIQIGTSYRTASTRNFLAIPNSERRAIYARHIRQLRIIRVGENDPKHMRELLTVLRETPMPGLQELVVGISWNRAPSVITRYAETMVYRLLGRKTEKLHYFQEHTNIDRREDRPSWRPWYPLILPKDNNVKDLCLGALEDWDLAIKMVEQLPKLSRCSFEAHPNDFMENDAGLGLLLEALSKSQSLHSLAIRDVCGVINAPEIPYRLKADRFSFYNISGPYVRAILPLLAREALKYVHLVFSPLEFDPLVSLLGYNHNNEPSTLRTLILEGQYKSTYPVPFPVMTRIAQMHPCLRILEMTGRPSYWDMLEITDEVVAKFAKGLPNLEVLRIQTRRGSCVTTPAALISLGHYCKQLERLEYDCSLDITTDKFYFREDVQEILRRHDDVGPLFPSLVELVMRGTEPNQAECDHLLQLKVAREPRTANQERVARFCDMVDILFPKLQLLKRFGRTERWVSADVGGYLRQDSVRIWSVERFLTPCFWRQEREEYI